MPNITIGTTALPREDAGFQLGQWFWVKEKCRWDDYPTGMKKGQRYRWLGCIMHVGTNYVEIESPPDSDNSSNSIRVHFDETAKILTAEPDASTVIKNHAAASQAKVTVLLEEVRALTARLGLQPVTNALPSPTESGNALVTMSNKIDVKLYEVALTKAKEEELPALFEAIKAESKELRRWMTAESLPIKAQARLLKGALGEIDHRIFNVSLYAGLTEEVVQCRKGDPAGTDEKLRIMQRRLYMDEECLMNYRAGGMEFKNIEEFDVWISEPENADRIMPFPRCLVSMRVRRFSKVRSADTLYQAFINIYLDDADKLTFLYIRNGDQIWRLSCAQNFGAMMFPDKGIYDTNQEMMIRNDRADKMITVHEYETRAAAVVEAERKSKAWRKANPKKHYFDDPHRHHDSFRPADWGPFNPTNVYFDDATRTVRDEVNSYNRIVLIVQGLLDRSPVLHPHPLINLFRADHMDRHVKLIYDATNALYAGDKPDFEAYRARLNSMIMPSSILTGQRDYWMEVEAERENKRARRDYRNHNPPTLKRYAPYGNPGPSTVASVSKWTPNKLTFSWTKEKRATRYGSREMRTLHIVVPRSRLFNISAYTVGEYRQFFNDPRTRQEYLKWAPLLLTAEDYYGKNTIKDLGDVYE